jgi:murein DD-endopeptidase MepM/ murein hydrolase activator NlpD
VLEFLSSATPRPMKRYTVLVANRASGVVRRFTVPLWPAVGICLFFASLPILMGLGARWSASAEIDALRNSNASLTMENESYRAATGELASQISSLQSAVSELGERSKLDPASATAIEKLPAVVKSRAMGGGAPAAAIGAAMAPLASPGPENTFGVLRDLLGMLEARLENVRLGVERREALAAATPSIWPVTGWLSSAYGSRRDPFTGAPDFHAGLDIAADRGEAVKATANGTVESAGYAGNYGNLLVLTHGFGMTTRYGHLARATVKQGQQVRRGDIIGFVGSTGRSTSSHLHYEVWWNNRLINPLRLLSSRR